MIAREFALFGPQMWRARPLTAPQDVRQVVMEMLASEPHGDWGRAVEMAALEQGVPMHVALEFVADVIEQIVGDGVLLDAYASAVVGSDRLSADQKRAHWVWHRLMPSRQERAAARSHLWVVK